MRLGKGQYVTVLERAKAEAEDYLAYFPPEQHGAILLGALASVYGKEDGGSDTAVWLARGKDKANASPLGNDYIQQLHTSTHM
jgi:hypothetical protein